MKILSKTKLYSLATLSVLFWLLSTLHPIALTEDPLSPTDFTSNGICEITSIVLEAKSSCNDNGTFDYNDDFFLVDLTVTFTDRPVTGNLEISHQDLCRSCDRSLCSDIMDRWRRRHV